MIKGVIAAIAAVLLALGMTSAVAHVGSRPHATQNWSPRPHCFKYVPINGGIPAGYKVKSVIREYNRKTNGVPPLKWRRGCNGGIADIRIDAVNNPSLNYCAKYDPDFGGGTHERITLNAAGTCATRKRESACYGIGASVGEHAYKRRRSVGVQGCMWITASGPDHVSRGEARALTRAW